MATLPYYRSIYATDLVHVLDPGANSLSICSLVPDSPDVEFIRGPGRRLRSLDQPEAFACALFWEALADQATYTVTRRELVSHGWPNPVAKLKGFLATTYNNLHPGFLLLAMSLGEGYRPARVDQALIEIGARVTAELQGCLQGLFEPVAIQMADALTVLALPDSIRAFVPYDNSYRLAADAALVDRWRRASRGLVDSRLSAAR